MYSESELESAVAAGALTQDAADALRAHVSRVRQSPNADEESFRLITSFNDVFVSIAGILVLVGAGIIGGGLFVAAAAWGMAEFFTRVRRMAFPSIVFFIAFVFGVSVFMTVTVFRLDSATSFARILEGGSSRDFLMSQSVTAAVLIAACALHWWRFMVPITVAVGVAAIARLVFTLIAFAVYPNYQLWMLSFVLFGGLAVFAYAMWWDIQDLARKTRKSDVAFWLHLTASPLIVHPIFVLIGFNMGVRPDGSNATVLALVAVLVYALLGLVAIIVDRRAILVSALAYVLTAAIYLTSSNGPSEFSIAFAIITIGSALLMLSAFWQNMRRAILPMLPPTLRNIMPIAA
jgi:hypothetical protein